MDGFKEFYRRNLPHWQPQDSIFFITFRLAHSIPLDIMRQLRAEQELERQSIRARSNGEQQGLDLFKSARQFFGKYDSWLDQLLEDSPRWLSQDAAARLVIHEIQRLDKQSYDLIAFCIIPKHVHLLIDTTGFNEVSPICDTGTTSAYPLTDTLRLLKGRTARYCNQAIGRVGDFWHHETYDHAVRDEQEFDRIFGYILENPVKAQLVSEWEKWPYTYAARN
jgi:putative transposase